MAYDSGLEFRIARGGGGISQAVETFYKQALLQSHVWFVASVAAAAIGLAVVVWVAIQVMNQPAVDGLLKSAPGLVTTAIAALFYRQAAATRRYAAELLKNTESDRRMDIACGMLSQISDDTRRDKLLERLALHFAGVSSSPESCNPPDN